MRALRIGLVLVTALVFFMFINSVAGRLFPATKVTEADDPYGSDSYSKCYDLQQSSLVNPVDGDVFIQESVSDNSAYEDCIQKVEEERTAKIKAGVDKRAQDQIKNIYVSMFVALLTLIVVALIFKRLPSLSAGMMFGLFVFILYFPVSNVASSWYSSVYSMSDEVKNSLSNVIIASSFIGFVGLVLLAIFAFEKKASAVTSAPNANNLS